MRSTSFTASRPGRTAAGFTMVEVLVSLTVLALVMAAIMTVVHMTSRSKTTTANSIESTQAARVAIDMMARDLRCAGYGADLNYATPQPPIAYIDSTQVLINQDGTGSSTAPRDTLAYDPALTPRPYPLIGTQWTPPIKYRSGAEIVRWTLDVNNDGLVDQNDVLDPNGVDAQRTPNPNDFELVRQVYGDSLNGSPGNGGATERIALVRAPGGGVPPLFTVYLEGSSTPWDWSAGPVPAARLMDIQRIVIQVDAPSGRTDWRGSYAETRLRTEVNSLRNVPDFGATQYAVDGTVFVDTDLSGTRGAGEAGIYGSTVRLGNFSAATDSNGYFIFRVPAGSYTLKHTPPPGYGTFTSPDSFLVTVPPAVTRSFADTARTGGWVQAFAWNDADGDGVVDGGEAALQNVLVTLTPTNQAEYTDAAGNARLFAPVGSFSVAVTPPDSFTTTTPNPVSGTMTDGGSQNVSFGLSNIPVGQIGGYVFRDNNRNGTRDGGEGGLANVWVGVTNDGGVTVLGYDYTDASGVYEIQAPANDPPGTQPYSIFCIPPAGYFPTSSTAIGSILLGAGQQLSDRNFGMVGYQIITLNANRVLSLASADLIEQDWSGNINQWDSKGHKDADIVLGSDAAGSDQVSAWFNQYNSTPTFNANPDYSRSAAQSVLGLALDTLDTDTPGQRPDLVTGTRKAGAGNLFVWLNQNTSGNLGYFPATPTRSYTTQDLGDVQAVLTYDCAGGSMPDLVVGTRSPTVGRGTLEVWSNGEGATPVFTRDEVYPPAGGIPGASMGEVTCMVLADLDGDLKRDLVVGTRTGTYSGELLFFKFVSKVSGARFVYQTGFTISDAAVTALTCVDVDGDGKLDVVAGEQTAVNAGRMEQYRNTTGALWSFVLRRTVAAPGVVQALASGDFGGLTRSDVVMGWRQAETSYVGGLLLYYTDLGLLPANGVDPSGGAVVNMVPALTTSNFNYGVQPSTPSPPFLLDLAAGVKVTASTGALVVFIR